MGGVQSEGERGRAPVVGLSLAGRCVGGDGGLRYSGEVGRGCALPGPVYPLALVRAQEPVLGGP